MFLFLVGAKKNVVGSYDKFIDEGLRCTSGQIYKAMLPKRRYRYFVNSVFCH